jgi:hypothetical protein
MRYKGFAIVQQPGESTYEVWTPSAKYPMMLVRRGDTGYLSIEQAKESIDQRLKKA